MTNNAVSQRDTRTYREMRGDKSVPDDVREERLVDETLGLIAQILVRRGDTETASILGRIARTELEYDDNNNTYWGGGESEPEQVLFVEYEPEDADDFLRAEDTLRDVYFDVIRRTNFPLAGFVVRETLPVVRYGWREQLNDALNGKRPINQGRKLRREGPQYIDDYLTFTNAGELKVYRALKRMQENDYPREDTIGIYPLAGGRIAGRTWEPDMLVTYQGRTGVLEIDGPHHNQRRALDTTREHILRESGIAWVDRVTVEAVDDPEELQKTLRRFMRELVKHR